MSKTNIKNLGDDFHKVNDDVASNGSQVANSVKRSAQGLNSNSVSH